VGFAPSAPRTERRNRLRSEAARAVLVTSDPPSYASEGKEPGVKTTKVATR